MKKNMALAINDPQGIIERFSAENVTRIHVESEQKPMRRMAVKLSALGIAIEYESGIYSHQKLEMELKK